MELKKIENQYSKYPALISLIKMQVDNNRIGSKRYAMSTVHEYNRDIKQFLRAVNGKHMYNLDESKISTGLVNQILKGLRRDYIKRVDDSLKLNVVEKDHLKNYIVAKHRETVRNFM